MDPRAKKEITIFQALIPVIFLVISLFFTLQKFEGDPHIPILASAGVAALVAMKSGYQWNELENGVVETIKMSMSAILILMIIGMIIGTWILSGVVPTMIYYGLQILSPGIFLVATTLICAVVSLATGSSWTTAGTVGIALIGIGQGLEIPLEIVAGAIISGAYFGDKMSPLSDTTNLAPSMAGSDLFDHIRHMIYTTGPSLIISLILFGILGFKYAGNNMDTASINVILDGLTGQFTISPLLLIPPILVIGMVILKIPAIPGLIGGTVIGGVFATIFQGAGMSDIINAAHYGFESNTGLESIDNLLTRGGLDSMMWTVSLILCAMAFGGIMEKSGMLHAIAKQILKYANSTGSIILSTILTSIAMNLIAGDQYLSIVIPGRMYKDIYDEKGLHPKNLSRVLEDSGTLSSPLIPWNTCGSFMWQTLGVHPFAYLPYAFLNLINPIVSIFYGYTGITMERIDNGSSKENEHTA
ncbi:Na+/H+ antiporter NhaC [Maledivibacter halophilus]|uniref:Na+:H+ antiporter, NhaC family n=1 Tax=Maledivibacter halophilus TaxID=36842 RepID=A0A1T5KIG7_9FIRM|nr:Na+/H+ antiporter NhaC [Maledivibacter halophilus]SKC63249.1 Na+:H+ antiporter, NhaC family [Maledivibacter halophilus]